MVRVCRSMPRPASRVGPQLGELRRAAVAWALAGDGERPGGSSRPRRPVPRRAGRRGRRAGALRRRRGSRAGRSSAPRRGPRAGGPACEAGSGRRATRTARRAAARPGSGRAPARATSAGPCRPTPRAVDGRRRRSARRGRATSRRDRCPRRRGVPCGRPSATFADKVRHGSSRGSWKANAQRGVDAGDRRTVDPDGAGRRRVQPGRDPQERRLAAAAGTEDGEHLAGTDPDGNVTNHEMATGVTTSTVAPVAHVTVVALGTIQRKGARDPGEVDVEGTVGQGLRSMAGCWVWRRLRWMVWSADGHLRFEPRLRGEARAVRSSGGSGESGP